MTYAVGALIVITSDFSARRVDYIHGVDKDWWHNRAIKKGSVGILLKREIGPANVSSLPVWTILIGFLKYYISEEYFKKLDEATEDGLVK